MPGTVRSAEERAENKVNEKPLPSFYLCSKEEGVELTLSSSSAHIQGNLLNGN